MVLFLCCDVTKEKQKSEMLLPSSGSVSERRSGSVEEWFAHLRLSSARQRRMCGMEESRSSVMCVLRVDV